MTTEWGASASRALGWIFMGLVFAPTALGTALGLSALEKKLPNPPAVGTAIGWNGALLLICMTVMLVGLLRG